MTEVEVLLEELVELESKSEKVAEQQNEEKKAAAEKEKKQATEMRQRALERFGKTRKRQTETEKEEGKKETKRRRSGEGALEWLKEKGESLRELKERELQDKKQEREIQKMQHEQFVGQLHMALYPHQNSNFCLQHCCFELSLDFTLQYSTSTIQHCPFTIQCPYFKCNVGRT